MAKGVAISFVVLGHIASPLGAFIFAWHMPFFFFVGGFFLKTETGFFEFIRKNFRRTMVPFFIFGLIGLLATYIKNIVLSRQAYDIKEGLSGIFYWMDYAHMNNYGLVLWFLPALLVAKILVTALLKYIKNYYIIGMMLLLLVVLIIKANYIIPFGIDKGIIGSLWLFLGYLYFQNREKFLEHKNMIIAVLLIALIFLPIPQLNIALKIFSLPWYNYLYSLSAIILLITALKKSEDYRFAPKKLLTFLGANSMFIFLIHPYTNNVAYLLVEKIWGDLFLLKFLITMTMLYVLVLIKNNYLNPKYSQYV